MTDKFDAPLLGILQSCGELEPFLEVILGFLYRKTDFFLPLSVDQTMGFSPGAAQAKLLKVFKKFEKLREMSMTRESPKSPPQQQKPLTPPVTPGTTSASNVSSATATAVSSAPATVSSASSAPASASTSSFSTAVATPPVSSAPTVASPTLASLPGPPKEEKIEEIQGDWSTSNWDHHNGGFTEKYAWSQTAQDVDLKMALPSPNVTASQLKIDIKAHSLNVQLKTEEGLRSVLEEKLHSIIKPEESMWSLHKENNPNGQLTPPDHLSPRWNQKLKKFSSMVSKRKPVAKDKPQRVRGPAIQWSAETLFNTADEAKAYITRDNKWKFRYSHQTTEGKKVYYQCTQRAKLGCGALCHVVYHHAGTALLYTNGEFHNHLEYNSGLLNKQPPANVAISVADAANLLQTLVSNTSSPTRSPTTQSTRCREDWTPVTIFPNHSDAKSFIEQEGLWKFSYSHNGSLGRKVFYDCAMKAKDGCTSKVQLLYHAEETAVSYLINGAPHKHQTDTILVRKRGIPSNVKDAILEAFDSGFTDTKLVTKYLQIRGIEPPSAAKIKVFLNKHRIDGFHGYDNAPISMLQWPFAPAVVNSNNKGDIKEEENVMGEVAASC